MRVFLTGGTGFIGGAVARKLRERGDDVAALARSAERARELIKLGCEVIQGDLADIAAIERGIHGADAVIHGAAVYKIGIPKSEYEAMWEADESYERPKGDGFLSKYDETKYRSHEIAQDRIAAGAPIVVVQPGGVYGPNDHSEVANLIAQARTGKLRAKAFPQMGASFVHVEDVADGILLALDKGEVGESYILGGERGRLGELLDKVAVMSGHKPTRLTLPPIAIKLSAPLGPVLGPALGFPPNLREAMSTAHNVTYWARDDKARAQLGYKPRDLDTGLRETLAAAD